MSGSEEVSPPPRPLRTVSASSTDSTALAERLTAYNAFEAEMNERYGYISDCSLPNAPALAYRDGRCVAE